MRALFYTVVATACLLLAAAISLEIKVRLKMELKIPFYGSLRKKFVQKRVLVASEYQKYAVAKIG